MLSLRPVYCSAYGGGSAQTPHQLSRSLRVQAVLRPTTNREPRCTTPACRGPTRWQDRVQLSARLAVRRRLASDPPSRLRVYWLLEGPSSGGTADSRSRDHEPRQGGGIRPPLDQPGDTLGRWRRRGRECAQREDRRGPTEGRQSCRGPAQLGPVASEPVIDGAATAIVTKAIAARMMWRRPGRESSLVPRGSVGYRVMRSRDNPKTVRSATATPEASPLARSARSAAWRHGQWRQPGRDTCSRTG
jgi:hypothetical protein